MPQPGFHWYEIPSKDDPVDEQVPDFSGGSEPTKEYLVSFVGSWPESVVWYLLVEEVLTGFTELTDGQVSAAGMEPNRTVTGGE